MGWGFFSFRREACSTDTILDTLDRHDSRQFSGWFARFAEPLTRRSEPGEPTAVIDKTDVQVAEANDMVAGLQFGNSDELADKRLADEDELIFPSDLAGGAYAANLMIGIIPRVLDVVRQRTW